MPATLHNAASSTEGPAYLNKGEWQETDLQKILGAQTKLLDNASAVV